MMKMGIASTERTCNADRYLISSTENDAMKEAAWNSYVSKALAEVEAIKDDPAAWLSLDEFWKDKE